MKRSYLSLLFLVLSCVMQSQAQTEARGWVEKNIWPEYAAGATPRYDGFISSHTEMVRFPGGYFDSSLKPHYYATDYQGNNVMVLDNSGRMEQSYTYYPYGEPVRRPTATFGDEVNRHLYGDKEYMNSFGEATYDQEARAYSPSVIPFFTTQDPKAGEMPWMSPYAFCMNNPMLYIDPTGEEPTPYEAVLMAAISYCEKGSDEWKFLMDVLTDVSDWDVSSFDTKIRKNDTKWYQSGLQSELFERTVNGKTEYAYAFAGTEGAEDIIQDILQPFGLSTQYTLAIHNARILSRELGDAELTFVGHSLGGGESIAGSKATGRNAITFNPAAVSLATESFNYLYEKATIKNYIAVPNTGFFGTEILTWAQNNILGKADGMMIPVQVSTSDAFEAHKIKYMIKALKNRKR